MANVFVKKVTVKAGIPPSISEETIRRLLKKTVLKWTHFLRKGIISENDLKLRLKFVRKVYRKRGTCNYEYQVMRKHMVQERVEFKLFKTARYY